MYPSPSPQVLGGVVERHAAFRLSEAIPRQESPRQKNPKKDTTWELENEKLFIKGWLEKQAFLSPIPEWSVGVSLMLVSLVHLPNGRSSTEGDKKKIIVLKGAQSAPPIRFQLRRQTEQREDSSHHQNPPPQLGGLLFPHVTQRKTHLPCLVHIRQH